MLLQWIELKYCLNVLWIYIMWTTITIITELSSRRAHLHMPNTRKKSTLLTPGVASCCHFHHPWDIISLLLLFIPWYRLQVWSVTKLIGPVQLYAPPTCCIWKKNLVVDRLTEGNHGCATPTFYLAFSVICSLVKMVSKVFVIFSLVF